MGARASAPRRKRTLISRPKDVYSLYIRSEAPVITRIQKWGNSLGLRIPRSFAHEARVDQGSAVDLSVRGGRLIIVPLKPGRWRLEALLARITPGNLHTEMLGDEPVGRESL